MPLGILAPQRLWLRAITLYGSVCGNIVFICMLKHTISLHNSMYHVATFTLAAPQKLV